jgi:hypothetical protein
MAMPADDCTTLDTGDIRFYDNYVPTLPAGDYLLNVTQQVNPTNSGIDACYAASQVFSVQGPRYSLPGADIFSVFPPNNGQGIFDQFLPHVVLTPRELPWERNVFDQTSSTMRAPWLALLLFVEGETIDGQPTLLAPQVANWQQNRTMVATIPAASFYAPPAGDGILWPALEQEWYETSDYLAQTPVAIIDVSPQAFSTLVPSLADLPYLTHARQVDPTAKDADVLKVSGDGWYSVVVCNRLPDAPPAGTGAPGQRNIVHLVSLEGLTDYVPGAPSSKPVPPGTTRVRLISFQSWTFTCLPELGESFSEIMNGLLTDAQGDPKQTALALPVEAPDTDDPATQYAYQALQNGYVPLQYQTRLGEQTVAWYRGPFSPVPVVNFVNAEQQGAQDPAGWKPFGTASAAMVYDKTYGVFDASYGVAWETGRLHALADGSFGVELLDWERNGHALIDTILERKSQIAALKNFDPSNPNAATEQTLLDLIQPYAITDKFMQYLLTQFSQQIAPQLDSPPPTPPDPPFPAYPSLPPPPVNPTTIADLLQETEVQEAIRAAGGQELYAITDWLARLYLLHGVPFEALLANPALLPEESVRFFYVDQNWLGALAEGALSIGIQSSRDIVYQDLMKDLIWNTMIATVQQERDQLLGAEATVKPAGGTLPFDQLALTGMLLRSAVVSGWPGLEATAFAATQPGTATPDLSTEIGLLRMDRLSSDVLLCLWPTVPAVVTLGEPREGVAFGFEDPPAGEGYYLYPRSVATSSYGTSLGDASGFDATPYIDQYRRVGITGSGGLLQAIQAKLPSGSPSLQIRDFAVQMIKVPESAVFAAQSLAGSAGSTGSDNGRQTGPQRSRRSGRQPVRQ